MQSDGIRAWLQNANRISWENRACSPLFRQGFVEKKKEQLSKPGSRVSQRTLGKQLRLGAKLVRSSTAVCCAVSRCSRGRGYLLQKAAIRAWFEEKQELVFVASSYLGKGGSSKALILGWHATYPNKGIRFCHRYRRVSFVPTPNQTGWPPRFRATDPSRCGIRCLGVRCGVRPFDRPWNSGAALCGIGELETAPAGRRTTFPHRTWKDVERCYEKGPSGKCWGGTVLLLYQQQNCKTVRISHRYCPMTYAHDTSWTGMDLTPHAACPTWWRGCPSSAAEKWHCQCQEFRSEKRTISDLKGDSPQRERE